MIANERKNLFHILKIYSLKIHVGLNQKFTAENSCSKNLHLKIHGLKIMGGVQSKNSWSKNSRWAKSKIHV
jgi:hypothetical protein